MNKRIALFIIVCFVPILLRAESHDFPDPYPEVYQSIEVLPLNLHGWHGHEKEVLEIFAKKEIRVVAEVGSWLGKWTVFVADLLPQDGTYYAVDHWKGSPEHHNPGTLEYTFLPTLYQQFLSNVIHYGLTEKVVPVRMNSLDAAKLFKKLNIFPDLIYIDAGHDYRSVLADITAWYPLLNKGGIFCGDDWNLGDLSKAVRSYASKHRLKVLVEGEFWWFEEKKI